ncbi:GNAT family N-acetyltransferase [Kaistella carnis]|uniref:GNAT family N-acetyltransferase n=1 Tax=Kaistella carnis TaxID=1241979 RepID=UPI0035E3D603
MNGQGYWNFLIRLKSGDTKIGSIGIFVREGLEIHGIGFSFLPDFEGKGFGFEVASKLLETSFSELELKKISAITTKENVGSQKLIIKLVFFISVHCSSLAYKCRLVVL